MTWLPVGLQRAFIREIKKREGNCWALTAVFAGKSPAGSSFHVLGSDLVESHQHRASESRMDEQAGAFKLSVSAADIADLRERLGRTRFPDQAPGPAWEYGADVTWMRKLVEYWRDDFDWRAQEARLNAFAQSKVRLHEIDLHFLHVEGKGPDPCPLLLSHGWPGSVFEFLELIPMLTDPGQFGGDPADSFTVVAPSLPGYGLSFSPGQPRFGVEEIADCFASLMTDVLGYRRFGAQGGDWGSFITSRLAYSYGDRLIGIHLNMMPLRRDPKMVTDPTPEEQKYLEELTTWLKEGTGYQWIQGTRPQTLAFALTNSRQVSPRGSLRSFAHGPIAAAIWSRCLRRTSS